jgi:hypothetical protein
MHEPAQKALAALDAVLSDDRRGLSGRMNGKSIDIVIGDIVRKTNRRINGQTVAAT